jgi:hypothetical protein
MTAKIEGVVVGSWFAADGSEVGFIRFPDGRTSTPIVDLIAGAY